MNILANPDTERLELGPQIHRYDGFQYHPLVTEDQRVDLARHRLRQVASEFDRLLLVVARDDAGLVRGVLIAEPFDMGRRHFKIGMAHLQAFRLDPTYGDLADREAMRAELFGAYEAWRRERGIVHTAFRIDSEDLETLHFLEARGFRLMDTIVAYLYNKHAIRRVPPLKSLFQLRDYRDDDREAIIELASGRFQGTRFARDVGLSAEGLNTFYREWAEKLCAGEMADRLMVAQTSEGQVVGFLGYKLDRMLEEVTGVRVMGGGLGAVSPKAAGAYPALLRTAIAEGAVTNDAAELETQVQNGSVLRVWHALRCTQVRVNHTLHCLSEPI
ncbi:hypothetical protein SCOR_07985 [Sulfidibacter corallicola]|uniref:N-acetyltransferase domain-containing protein n=1 Tax=Sulfidibacter corallicola TaxID=2818388 RepID=A0A8A4TMT4_SULCO|nr:hypothetical protein [Sulfidibacter corallicola]QTD51299.1 hypothetical protein J3U87_02425 [Sulfidibacter corallicola]